ncbi:hypothetical protein [Turicibacter sanguinis]|uniref:hypothetical protein n=1 Tax=Turicibacter sanguinis TaxID=154288 RepID=UPI001047BCE0|nr:hypothetical protein [Turicibacter sanguinis]QJS19224.1 hypothetical protein HLK68_08110 [Turicibacter sanguinis]
MKTNQFNIILDLSILKKLRNKINEQYNISYSKQYGKYRAWDKICSIMDRLDDTVAYLNEIKLNTGKYRRSAFDFYDFMNNAAVVVDCIKELAKIFDISDDRIKNSTDIFKQLGSDGTGTDEKYFQYLRSLCSVHPIETSHHKIYQANDFECSPYVIWNNQTIWFNDDCDLYAIVYTSKDEGSTKRVQIYIPQIFEYVKTRLEFVNEIIDGIQQYHQNIISDFKNRPIKSENEFNTYVEYLENLEKELVERYGTDLLYSFNPIIDLFKLKLSNSENQEKMNLYLNALKYAIKFEHSSLQNMTCDGFENNGLLYPKMNTETSLFNELYSPHSNSDEVRSYAYQLQKINCLSYDSEKINKEWAYRQLEEIRPFLERYVSFNNVQSDFEYYALVQLALYLDCLKHNCLINKNIPNDLKFRIRLLSDEEYRKLISDE